MLSTETRRKILRRICIVKCLSNYFSFKISFRARAVNKRVSASLWGLFQSLELELRLTETQSGRQCSCQTEALEFKRTSVSQCLDEQTDSYEIHLTECRQHLGTVSWSRWKTALSQNPQHLRFHL